MIRPWISTINRVKPSSQEAEFKKVRLHAAERLNDFPQEMWKDFINSLNQNDIRYYPDCRQLANKIKNLEGLNGIQYTQPVDVMLADGSDRCIRSVFEVFVPPESEVITTGPCFPMYQVYSEIYQAKLGKIPYYKDKTDIDLIIDCVNHQTSLVIISNPNSPIGDSIPLDRIEGLCRVAKKYNCTVVIDEAYIEFADIPSAKCLLRGDYDIDNLIVIRTFSKAWGSAGIRCGYAISTRKNIELLQKVSPMNEISGLTIKWIDNLTSPLYRDHVLDYATQIKQNRKWACEYFQDVHGFNCRETDCNWIYVQIPGGTRINKDYVVRYSDVPWQTEQDKREGYYRWMRLCIPTDRQLIQNLVVQK